MYERKHATITYETTRWGTPSASIQICGPTPDLAYGQSRWHLVSSAGMPGLSPLRSDGQSWTYHVHRTDGPRGERPPGEWHGCTSHAGLEDSIDELLADLTQWEAEHELNDLIQDHVYRLRRDLGALVEVDTPRRVSNIRKRWPHVQETFAQLQGILFEGPAN